MSRPTLVSLNVSNTGWIARFNSNFDKIVKAPFPLGQQPTLSSLNSTFHPPLYKDCLCVVEDTHIVYKSNGSVWKPFYKQLTYIAQLSAGSSLDTVKTALNNLIADMLVKGYMDNGTSASYGRENYGDDLYGD